MKVFRVPFDAAHGRLNHVFRAVGGVVQHGHSDGFGSAVRWRRTGRFSTAAMPSEMPQARGRGKKLPREERRAMVESFVNKALNEGKFPNISVTQKEVGGSYYVIRDIIQELKYVSKHGPSDETYRYSSVKGATDVRNRTTLEVEFPRDESSAEKVSISHRTIEVSHDRTTEETKDMSTLGVKTETVVEMSADAELQEQLNENQEPSSQLLSENLTEPPGSVLTIQEKDYMKPVTGSLGVHSDHAFELKPDRKVKEDKFYSTPAPGTVPTKGDGSVSIEEPVLLNLKDKALSQEMSKPCVSGSERFDDKASSDLDGSFRATLSKTEDKVDAEKKPYPSFWSNLKSFAGSIISIWNKY